MILRLHSPHLLTPPSRHRETGHVIFIKLPDFLGRESVNRERSFSHIIIRVPVAFPHAKWKKDIWRKLALVKITAEGARRLAARDFIIVESISTRVINASKTHLVRDICVSRYQGKFSAEISATIMSGIYHREITALLPFIRRRSIIITLSRQFISAPNANWEIKQRHRGRADRECRRDAW